MILPLKIISFSRETDVRQPFMFIRIVEVLVNLRCNSLMHTKWRPFIRFTLRKYRMFVRFPFNSNLVGFPICKQQFLFHLCPYNCLRRGFPTLGGFTYYTHTCRPPQFIIHTIFACCLFLNVRRVQQHFPPGCTILQSATSPDHVFCDVPLQ